MVQRRILKNIAPNAIIEQAVNGEEAMEIIRLRTEARTTNPSFQPMFDVIIMDQYMGDSGGVMLGSDTIIAMRRDYKVDSWIIGCSGNDIDAEFIQAGANVVWGKPLPSNQVMIEHFREGLDHCSRHCS